MQSNRHVLPGRLVPGFPPAPPIGPMTVRVRWESALPVRAAELKAHEWKHGLTPLLAASHQKY